jgi:hypothetical protein
MLLAAAGAAGAWSAPQNVSNQPSGSRAFGPRLARDPLGNTHAVWTGGADPSSNWRVAYQVFNGASWSAVTWLSGPNATRPDIAADGNGTLHLVYEEAAEDNIWYRSKPAGGSWTSPVNLKSGGRSIAASIAVNSAGNRIIVAWHEDGQTGGEWDILVNTFNGSAWSGPANISNNSSLSSNARVAIDAAGNMHAAWSDADVFYRKRDVNGNWGSTVTVHDTTTRAGLNSLAASSDGYVHCGYTVDDGAGWEIWYRYTNGVTWSAPVNVSNHPGTSDDIEASITADYLGRLYAVWHDYTSIYYSTAAGRASPWSAREAIVSGKYAATAPDVVIDNAMTARLAWQSRPASSDNWNIYVSSQSVGTPGPHGTLAGTVRDASNNPLAGATVSTGNAAGLTNASGQYSFAVPVGTYTATAARQYFTSQSVGGVVISENATATRDFQLAALPPGPVTGLTVTPGNLVNTLAWTHPADGQFVGTRVRVRTDGVYPSGPQDGAQVADVPGAPGGTSSLAHPGLTNGVTYRYAAFAYDNNSPRTYAAGAQAAGTPAGPCDFDRDGDVDQADWGSFQACLTGAFNPQTLPACAGALLDADDDVDNDDVLRFIGCVSGPGVYANPACLPG